MAETAAIAELVARLRSLAGPTKPNVLDEAADVIEMLEKELEQHHADTNSNA